MPVNDPRHAELVAWLREEKYSDEQIEKILVKVAAYDAQTLHESVFDSIDRGDFNIASIIQEALDG